MRRVRWGVLSAAKIGLVKVIPGMQRGSLCEVVASHRATSRPRRRRPAVSGSRRRMAATRRCWPTRRSTRSTTRCRTTCTCRGRSRRSRRASTCCARSRSGSARPRRATLLEASRRAASAAQGDGSVHVPPSTRSGSARSRSCARAASATLRTIHSFFSYFNDDPPTSATTADIGGGGLMDIGCYDISLSRFLFGARAGAGRAAPSSTTRRSRSIAWRPAFSTSAAARPPSPARRSLPPTSASTFFGTTGRVEIEIPFNAPPDRPCRLWHQHGAAVDEIVLETARPVHHPGRPLLSRGPRGHAGADAARGRGGEHAGDRGRGRERAAGGVGRDRQPDVNSRT